MKKILLAVLVIILLLVAYFVFKPYQASVYVSNVKPQEAEAVRMQIIADTDGKIAITCQNSANQEAIECKGDYTASNLIQLIQYQNAIFETAQNNQLNFVAGGSFIATLTD